MGGRELKGLARCTVLGYARFPGRRSRVAGTIRVIAKPTRTSATGRSCSCGVSDAPSRRSLGNEAFGHAGRGRISARRQLCGNRTGRAHSRGEPGQSVLVWHASDRCRRLGCFRLLDRKRPGWHLVSPSAPLGIERARRSLSDLLRRSCTNTDPVSPIDALQAAGSDPLVQCGNNSVRRLHRTFLP